MRAVAFSTCAARSLGDGLEAGVEETDRRGAVADSHAAGFSVEAGEVLDDAVDGDGVAVQSDEGVVGQAGQCHADLYRGEVAQDRSVLDRVGGEDLARDVVGGKIRQDTQHRRGRMAGGAAGDVAEGAPPDAGGDALGAGEVCFVDSAGVVAEGVEVIGVGAAGLADVGGGLLDGQGQTAEFDG